MKLVILYSGGLDSFIMKRLAHSRYPDVDPILVHFDIGQDYSEKERVAIEDSGYDVDIRKVEWLSKGEELSGKQENNSGNIFIPGRNMILSSLAASIYSPDEVWMGGLKGEDHKRATDKNKTFIDKSNDLWSYVYSPFDTVPRLVFPLIQEGWGKFEAVEWIYKNGLATAEELLATSSCLADTVEKNCGHCVVCCRRKYIFMQLGIHEEYEKDPLTGEANLKMCIEMLNTKEGDVDIHYDEYRMREIIPGLKIQFQSNDHDYIIGKLSEKLRAL
jgi:7-cyano-7-deazaguanine synthase in queuosine biosynthesis